MIERREFAQYDILLDSQRFNALVAQGATSQTIEQQKAYIERQLKTDIGERIGVAESHFVYEIRGNKLYGQEESEPFENVIRRGVFARGNRERERAELTCFQLTQAYFTDSSTPDGAMIFYASQPGSGYTEKYLDVQRKVGDAVHSVRYLSTLSNQEYRQKVLSINPNYEEVIPENPTDLDFFSHPVIVPSHLPLNPDQLAEYVLDGKKGISKEEFEEFWIEIAPQATSIINTLVDNPSALNTLKVKQNQFYERAKLKIEYIDGGNFGGGGCGSGACPAGPDGLGPLEFGCPSCGGRTSRPMFGYAYNCEKCGSDEVLPKSLRKS